MRKILIGVVVGALGYYAYDQYRDQRAPGRDADVEAQDPAVGLAAARYHCDGRIYCSQMTSCEEATYFLRNCPGVKMDGEGDGIPCERQWCGSH